MFDVSKRIFSIATILALTVSLVNAASAFAQADFYKGKTITVYVSTTPGALYDRWRECWRRICRNIFPANPI
jgi:hypothetical protein